MDAHPGDDTVRLISQCREALERLQLPAVQAVFLYGSVLRETSRLDSDLDLAVLDAERNHLSWRDQAQLMDALERSTGYNVDLRMLRDLSPSHQAHVLAAGRLLWVRETDRDELERYCRNAQAAVQSQSRSFEREWPRLLGRLALTPLAARGDAPV